MRFKDDRFGGDLAKAFRSPHRPPHQLHRGSPQTSHQTPCALTSWSFVCFVTRDVTTKNAKEHKDDASAAGGRRTKAPGGRSGAGPKPSPGAFLMENKCSTKPRHWPTIFTHHAMGNCPRRSDARPERGRRALKRRGAIRAPRRRRPVGDGAWRPSPPAAPVWKTGSFVLGNRGLLRDNREIIRAYQGDNR